MARCWGLVSGVGCFLWAVCFGVGGVYDPKTTKS